MPLSFSGWGVERSPLAQEWGTPVPDKSHLLASRQRRATMRMAGPGPLGRGPLASERGTNAWEGTWCIRHLVTHPADKQGISG